MNNLLLSYLFDFLQNHNCTINYLYLFVEKLNIAVKSFNEIMNIFSLTYSCYFISKYICTQFYYIYFLGSNIDIHFGGKFIRRLYNYCLNNQSIQ